MPKTPIARFCRKRASETVPNGKLQLPALDLVNALSDGYTWISTGFSQDIHRVIHSWSFYNGILSSATCSE